MSHINIIEQYEEHRLVIHIIIAAALLLVSPGVYVYLGSKAEVMPLKNNVDTRNHVNNGG